MTISQVTRVKKNCLGLYLFVYDGQLETER